MNARPRHSSLSDDERIARAESLLGRTFRDRALLLRALTHRSYAHEAKRLANDAHNERLEFLGDAVLSLVSAEALLAHSPSADEGELSRRRAAFVSELALALAAVEVGLGDLLRMGRGQEREGGGGLPSLLADAIEAVIGAAYLDGGLDAARSVVTRFRPCWR
jgi:ribonuclease-3